MVICIMIDYVYCCYVYYARCRAIGSLRWRLKNQVPRAQTEGPQTAASFNRHDCCR